MFSNENSRRGIVCVGILKDVHHYKIFDNFFIFEIFLLMHSSKSDFVSYHDSYRNALMFAIMHYRMRIW